MPPIDENTRLKGHKTVDYGGDPFSDGGTGFVATNPGASAYDANFAALDSFASDSSQQTVETSVPLHYNPNQDFTLYDVGLNSDCANYNSNYLFAPLPEVYQPIYQPSPYCDLEIDSGLNTYGQQAPIDILQQTPVLSGVVNPTAPLPVGTGLSQNAASMGQHSDLKSTKQAKSPKNKRAIQKAPRSPNSRNANKGRPKHKCGLCGQGVARRTDLLRHQECHCKYRNTANAAHEFHCMSCDHSTSRYDKLAEHCRKAGHVAPQNPRNSI